MRTLIVGLIGILGITGCTVEFGREDSSPTAPLVQAPQDRNLSVQETGDYQSDYLLLEDTWNATSYADQLSICEAYFVSTPGDVIYYFEQGYGGDVNDQALLDFFANTC